MFKERSTEKLIEYIQTLPTEERNLIAKTIVKQKAKKAKPDTRKLKEKKYKAMEIFLKKHRGNLSGNFKFNRDEAKLTMTGVPDLPGVASKILGPIAAENIEVDMIVQNVGENGCTDFTFTVNRNDFLRAKAVLDVLLAELGGKQVSGDDSIVKVSMVGVGMRSHSGIASTMFKALAAEGINIRMIATSEIKISVVVDEKYLELAVRTLHAAFDLDKVAD